MSSNNHPLTNRIYLDNSASTRLAPAVLQAMLPYLSENFGNASSIHAFGQQAKAALEKARGQVAQLIGAQPHEIVFVSGGTESDNLAIRGIASAYSQGQPGHIITSVFEHSAVRKTCAWLETQGWAVTYLPVYADGRVRVSDVAAALRDDTRLISIMHANNEIGTVQPLAEIGQLVKARRAARQTIHFHTDAVQSAGKIPINVAELGVDLLSISGHKIHGPQGIGALYLRKGVRLQPLMTGGRHERDRRPGTENVAAIVALGQACELATQRLPEMARVAALRDQLETGVLAAIAEIKFNGNREHRLPNITNISFAYVEGEALLIALDLKGIAVSTGSACSSGSVEPSPVLLAMGIDKELVRGSLRFSLSHDTTVEEINYLLTVLPDCSPIAPSITPLSASNGSAIILHNIAQR
jgi:cysteine desulfurase